MYGPQCSTRRQLVKSGSCSRNFIKEPLMLENIKGSFFYLFNNGLVYLLVSLLFNVMKYNVRNNVEIIN